MDESQVILWNEKKKKIQIIKEKVKFSLLANDILNMENPKDSIKEN